MEKLQEKYLTQLAKEKGTTVAKAAELMDVCIRMTAFKTGVDYNVVYNSIYEVEYLTSCLKVNCSTLELEECRKSCQCVEFEGKCHPKHFPWASKANENPDKYIEGPPSIPTDELLRIVKLASYLYYNYDGGGLTDNTFDALEYHLNKRLKLRGKRYEKIGAPPIEKIKAKLPYPMASLNKVKPGSKELLDFLALAKTPDIAKDGGALPAPRSIAFPALHSVLHSIAWSLKLDGVSGLAIYHDGKLDKLYTRGDGLTGGDVTYLKEFIKFPVLSKDVNIAVRGEFILPKRVWLEKYAGVESRAPQAYSNARSFVSAKVNSGHVSQGLEDIHFVAYELVNPDTKHLKSKGASPAKLTLIPKPSETFRELQKLGFEIVQNGLFKSPTVFDIITLYKDVRSSVSTEYYIDGLVLSIDETRFVSFPTGGASNPKHSVAFKMRLEEQIRKTKVLDVEWRKTRYGKLFPVVIFESVYTDGVRLHKASGHNAAHIRDWSMGKGTVIKVVRSGDVIPTIVDVEINNNIEPLLPIEAVTGPWYWKGHDIMLKDPDSDKTVQIKRIEHFFVTIGVPRLREKTIEKLWNAGYKDIKALTNAKPSDFIKIKGFGAKSSESHYKNIHEIMRRTRMDRYIPATTTFNIGIGRKLVKQLMRYHPTVLSEDSATIKTMLTKKKIPGFAAKRIENVSENVPKFREFLLSLNKEDIEYAMKKDEERRQKVKTGDFNPLIKGKTFVLTGFYGKVDLDLDDYLYDNLGNFSDAVTSSTEAVVAANIMDSSKKMIEAQKLGVKVLSLEEFKAAYNIPKKAGGSEDDVMEEAELGIRDDGDE